LETINKVNQSKINLTSTNQEYSSLIHYLKISKSMKSKRSLWMKSKMN